MLSNRKNYPQAPELIDLLHDQPSMRAKDQTSLRVAATRYLTGAAGTRRSLAPRLYLWVIHIQLGPVCQQASADINSWRLTGVSSVLFEGKAKHL